MVYARKFRKFARKFGRRRYFRKKASFRTKRVRKIAKRVARTEIKRMSEVRSNIADLPTSYSSVGTTWRINELRPASTDSASVYDIVGRSYRPRSIFTKNAILVGGASGTTGIDDYYNVVRVMVIETKGYEGNVADLQSKMSGVNVNSIASNRVPWIDFPRFAKALYDRSFLLKTIGDPDGAGYVPVPKKFTISIKLGGTCYLSQNQPVCFDRRFFLCMLTDSSVNPSPSIINGNVLFTYQDDN